MRRDRLRAFAANVLILNKNLDTLEARFQIDLCRPEADALAAQESGYYAQFPVALRAEAAAMGKHYETLFCLENSIRDLVTSQLLAAHGKDWWSTHVPQTVKDTVELNRKREAEAGLSLRSPDQIDYSNFGELLVIIEHNWDVFSDIFNNQKALRRVLSGLNMLRAPIAHCASLAPDEITRLELAIKDYYRRME